MSVKVLIGSTVYELPATCKKCGTVCHTTDQMLPHIQGNCPEVEEAEESDRSHRSKVTIEIGSPTGSLSRSHESLDDCYDVGFCIAMAVQCAPRPTMCVADAVIDLLDNDIDAPERSVGGTALAIAHQELREAALKIRKFWNNHDEMREYGHEPSK